MKILFFSSYFFPYISGLTLYPLRILKHLSKYAHVTVLTFPHIVQLSKQEQIVPSLSVLRMPYLFKISKGYISPQSIIYFIQELLRNNILINTLPNAEGLFLTLFAKLLKRRVVSIYLCDVTLEPGLFNTLIQSVLRISVYVQLLLSDTIVMFPDYPIPSILKKFIKSKIVLSNPPIENVTRDQTFLTELQNKKGDNIWIGYVGRMASEKGIEYLIRAITELNKKISNIQLIIAGPSPHLITGENKYINKIFQLIKENKVPHHEFYGLTDIKLRTLMKQLNILVVPSVNNTEAFGMTQVEAMFEGVPVIASALPGVRMPIQKTKMGILTQPGNVDSISKAVNKILDQKSAYTNKKKIENAKNIFNIRKVFELYENLILNTK